MTVMTLRSNIGKWIEQNKGEIIDSFPSVLLDYYIVQCKRGTAFIFDEYVNCNMSQYRIEYFPYTETGTDKYKTSEQKWYELYEQYEQLEG